MAFKHEVVGQTFGPYTFDYDWAAPALYALACGATTEHLDLCLETRGPKVLPTFSVVVALEPLQAALTALGGNLLTLVHGAQRCTVHRPIPAGGKLSTTATIRALYDKGKGALAIYDTRTVDEGGDPVVDTEWQIFYRGEGGFGGERGPDAPEHRAPTDRAPDHVITQATAPTQALLYRIASRDLNPIHADPDLAKRVGFPGPILHGLCTFGHAALALTDALAGGDPERLTSVEGRFSRPVLPGQSLVTEIFARAPGEALYTVKEAASGDAVLTLGRALYRS